MSEQQSLPPTTSRNTSDSTPTPSSNNASNNWDISSLIPSRQSCVVITLGTIICGTCAYYYYKDK